MAFAFLGVLKNDCLGKFYKLWDTFFQGFFNVEEISVAANEPVIFPLSTCLSGLQKGKCKARNAFIFNNFSRVIFP